MPRKKKPPLSLAEKMRKIASSGIGVSHRDCSEVFPKDAEGLETLDARIKKIFGLAENTRRRLGRMLFFVMYDIESDKVRRLVCKYLIKEGCTRVQKSIFLADCPVETYNKIRSELAEVQAFYENEDSIIILPVTSDYLRMMKIIGKNVDVDVITHSKNTLFF